MGVSPFLHHCSSISSYYQAIPLCCCASLLWFVDFTLDLWCLSICSIVLGRKLDFSACSSVTTALHNLAFILVSSQSTMDLSLAAHSHISLSFSLRCVYGHLIPSWLAMLKRRFSSSYYNLYWGQFREKTIVGHCNASSDPSLFCQKIYSTINSSFKW